MGYQAYTEFEVIHGPDVIDSDHPDHEQFLTVFQECTYASYASTNENHTKWYNDFENMEAISIKFPHSVFRVHRYGEDGQQWIIIAFNGKAQRIEGEVVFNTPDWSKLGVSQAYPEYLL